MWSPAYLFLYPDLSINFIWITFLYFIFPFSCINTPLVDLLTCLPFFSVCIQYCVCLKADRDLHFLRKLEKLAELQLKAFWPVSYVVSRVTVFLTAQYFKARFVWKCLHSTCTAVGLAVVAFIRLSVNSFGALICCSTCSLRLISAPLAFAEPFGKIKKADLFISICSSDWCLIQPALFLFLNLPEIK